MPNPMLWIARLTRTIQGLAKGRRVPALNYVGRFATRIFPPYEGPITLPDGTRMWVHSVLPPDRGLLFRGVNQPHLMAELQQHVPPGAHCMDVGANQGFFTVKFSSWSGKDGRVASFEANPRMAERVRRNLELNGFTHAEVVNRAVHDAPGEVEFYVAPLHHGHSSMHEDMAGTDAERITVSTIVLDDYIREQRWERLDAIKVDIEGNDFRALLGAKDAITRFRPFIVFEWHPVEPEIINQLRDLLDSLGYTYEYLALYGQRGKFEWENPIDRLIDILCKPPTS